MRSPLFRCWALLGCICPEVRLVGIWTRTSGLYGYRFSATHCAACSTALATRQATTVLQRAAVSSRTPRPNTHAQLVFSLVSYIITSPWPGFFLVFLVFLLETKHQNEQNTPTNHLFFPVTQ
ncbi:hypothetical protein I7I50_09179 [Histoplasma capsulatum G186AR]|uniref:Secreted protein n=1 Tax=Ajellomyces capsulatus TaxID=5037 RepID=A0A8H7YV38_AJECA|nr:hypothetical protein I7I52_06700 [Histoplasma capsulatum]QSS74124.1 hypothetical protein I7I50_09179 [Histoplasma capsulatum G186AR]